MVRLQQIIPIIFAHIIQPAYLETGEQNDRQSGKNVKMYGFSGGRASIMAGFEYVAWLEATACTAVARVRGS